MKIIKRVILSICMLTFFVPKMVKVDAYELKFEIIADEKRYVYFYPQIYFDKNGELEFVDKNAVINRIVLDLQQFPKDASVKFLPNDNEKFKIVTEKFGRAIDADELSKKIDLAILSGKNKVVIKSKQIAPSVTSEDIKKQTLPRSQFSTFYGYSTNERKHNIALCSSLLNGKIILPGEIFSFNEVVGKRSEQRGFLPAKIISNGQFVEGIGGGVCQVSSTLYNAFLLAGLTPIESHSHSLCVDYVKPSFDAMVSEGISDLRFKNSFDFPIYLECKANGENIKIILYGEKAKYQYKLISKVIETISATTTEVYTDDATLKNVNAKNGLKSEGYLCVYDGDSLIECKKLRTDTYKPLNGIIYLVQSTNEDN